jgi:hypothetical protein
MVTSVSSLVLPNEDDVCTGFLRASGADQADDQM